MSNKQFYILLFSFCLITFSCVKKNIKALEDDSKVYDPDISLNQIFYSKSVNGSNDIFQITPDGFLSKNITSTPNREEFFPAISHDAKKISYTSGDKLYQSSINGNDEIEITHNSIFSTKIYTPTFTNWSNKSNFISFIDSKNNNIYIIDSQYSAKTKESINLTIKNTKGGTVFSPTDSKIIHINQLLSDSSSSEIIKKSSLVIFDYSKNNDSLFTIVSSDNDISNVQFLKNGTQILYQANNHIYIIDINGENNKTLLSIDNSNSFSGFSTAPDNTKMVFSANTSGNYELYVFDFSTSKTTKITNTPENEIHPFWN